MRKVLIGAVILLVAGATTPTLGDPRMAKPKHEVERYCQQAITGQPHHEHVLVDNKTGDVTWTFHGGATTIYPAGRLDRMGTSTGSMPAGWRMADHQGLGRFSEKLRVMCSNHGFIPMNLSRGDRT